MTVATVDVLQVGASLNVLLGGDLDINSGATILEVLEFAVVLSDDVVLDLNAVRFLDAGGIRVLMAARSLAEARQVALRFEGCPPHLTRIFAVVNIDPSTLQPLERGRPTG